MSEPRFLPYGCQSIDEDDIQAVVDTLRSPFLTTGPQVDRFEAALCEATGASQAAVLNSGTSALHAMYAAMGIGPGSTILTSPLTFAATANAARYLGAEVRFADIDPLTGNLDPVSVAQALETGPADLLVPVDFAGHPADYDALRALAEAKGIPLVADAAHALGATYKGRKVGTLADLTELSLHPVKPITTAEGGAVLGADPERIAHVRRFRSHGITRDPEALQHPDGPWSYEMVELGFNYRLTDLQCALGLSQLHRLETFIARRRAIAAAYQKGLATCPGLLLPWEAEGVQSGWHLFVIRVAGDPAQRLPLFEALRAEGLGVQVHYVPVYWHPYYQGLGYPRGLCPKAESYYARAVSLPIFPGMTDAEVDRVIETVQAVARRLQL